MKRTILFLFTLVMLISFVPNSMFAATTTVTGSALTISNNKNGNFQGIATGQSSTKYTNKVHAIGTAIPANKIVVLSLTNTAGQGITASTSVTLNLINTSTGQELPNSQLQAGWMADSKMRYCKTNATATYKVVVKNDSAINFNYTINLYVLDSPSFISADTKGLATSSTARSYCISNSPENFDNNQVKGEYGYYLQRSIVKGNVNIYWEHVNKFSQAVSFGVLLWNKGTSDVTVNLNRRSYDSQSTSGIGAMGTVWVDWFNAVKKADKSEVPASTTSFTIKANTSKWVCLYNVPSNNMYNITNGVVDISIQSGKSLICDTYCITPNYETQTKNNVINAKLSPAGGIRGSGHAAFLNSTLSGSGAYRFAITGDHMPYLNSGEKITTYLTTDGITETKNLRGTYKDLDQCANYSVVYNINMNRTGVSKGIIRFNPLSNNAALYKNGHGLYAIVRKYYNGTWYTPVRKNLTDSDSTFTFDSSVQTGAQYYIVISGMSSMPAEVSFE